MEQIYFRNLFISLRYCVMKKVIIITLFFTTLLTFLYHRGQTSSYTYAIPLPETKDTTRMAPPISFKDSTYRSIVEIDLPVGFKRINSDSASFEQYLQNLPLITDRTTVLLYDGSPKYYQGAQLKIIDIDVGEKDLQQCADAVIRLRAEYQYKHDKIQEIGFHFLNGQYCNFSKYAAGYRIKVSGNKTWWEKTAKQSYSYSTFREYLELVFNYSNTHSLINEMASIKVEDMKIGDVFIRKSGSIGHAMMVVDMAINPKTGKKLFMLAQSYMPAQEMHVVINPAKQNGSPWYNLEFGNVLDTPEWRFDSSNLYRFR